MSEQRLARVRYVAVCENTDGLPGVECAERKSEAEARADVETWSNRGLVGTWSAWRVTTTETWERLENVGGTGGGEQGQAMR